MKERNIVLAIIFTIITCGIYGLYWFVVLTDDMQALTQEDGYITTGGTALLLSIVTCGFYGYYWAYKMGEKLNVIRERDESNHLLFLILQICGVGIISLCIMQSEINNHAAVVV